MSILTPVPSSTTHNPPYPADTRIRGWRFELDHERINQSDTWALAPPEMRPWLLMLWHVAWQQQPAGSYSNDPQIIAAKIGMDSRIFVAHRDILLRGWELFADGRLYHPVITEQILSYLDKRKKEKDRKRVYRSKMSHGTDMGRTWESGGSPHTSTSTSTSINNHPSDGSETQGVPRADPVPYQQIVKLWSEILPTLPQPVKLTAARKAQIRARWHDELPDLDAWAECFNHVKASNFLTGKVDPKPGHQRFRCTLDWITKQGNLIKVYEGKYDN